MFTPFSVTVFEDQFNASKNNDLEYFLNQMIAQLIDVFNAGQCQGDPFKVPLNSLRRAILNYDRLGIQTLGLWILANCLLRPEHQILVMRHFVQFY